MKCCLLEGLKIGWKYFICVVFYYVFVCMSMYRYWLLSFFKYYGNMLIKIYVLNKLLKY